MEQQQATAEAQRGHLLCQAEARHLEALQGKRREKTLGTVASREPMRSLLARLTPFSIGPLQLSINHLPSFYWFSFYSIY